MHPTRLRPASRHVLRRAASVLACFATLGMAAPAPAGETILQVLERSQSLRLASLTPVDADPRARLLQQNFERVLRAADGAAGRPITLQVVTGPVVAETFHGRVVVVNAELAGRPEGERFFVMAHEIGHAVHADWAAVGAVYQRHIPDEVLQSRTDAVAALLGREMSALSHEQELSADAYAMQVVGRLGYGLDVAIATFASHGLQPDTATHPGTRRRMASLMHASAP